MECQVIDSIEFEKNNTLLIGVSKPAGFFMTIQDLEENVLLHSDGQNIGDEFYWMNSATWEISFSRNIFIALPLPSDEKYHLYQYHNLFVESAVQLMVQGNLIANVFAVKCFHKPPNIIYFLCQSGKYDFDQNNNPEQLKEVSVVIEVKLKTGIKFLLNKRALGGAKMMQRLRQIHFEIRLQQEKALLKAQNRDFLLVKTPGKESYLILNSILNALKDSFRLLIHQKHLLEVNDTFLKMSGYQLQELVNGYVPDREAHKDEISKNYIRIKLAPPAGLPRAIIEKTDRPMKKSKNQREVRLDPLCGWHEITIEYTGYWN